MVTSVEYLEGSLTVAKNKQYLAIVPHLFLDVTGHAQRETYLYMDRFTLENTKDWHQELLEAEIVGNLKCTLGLVEHFAPVQGGYPDLASHMTVVD